MRRLKNEAGRATWHKESRAVPTGLVWPWVPSTFYCIGVVEVVPWCMCMLGCWFWFQFVGQFWQYLSWLDFCDIYGFVWPWTLTSWPQAGRYHWYRICLQSIKGFWVCENGSVIFTILNRLDWLFLKHCNAGTSVMWCNHSKYTCTYNGFLVVQISNYNPVNIKVLDELFCYLSVKALLPPLGQIWDEIMVWRKNCLCATSVLCSIVMVHKDTNSSSMSVNCIGLWSCLVYSSLSSWSS